ncbi:metal ABC transporter solute-binding protein, Zn/Mn family [Aquimarina agarilytica]|uniref:metal ABC transporter solute-binding protein, Zn/Mn family n=1 Tax=Aquimarina agarilytica TaxID=1087449 RepID=UPI00028997AB|nr:zinc ABC transporter substrate-binding protein [Aquimarina agarilytica]
MKNAIQLFSFLLALLLMSCGKKQKNLNDKLNIVTTTTMITDMITAVGGDKVSVQGLMGSGVDPHLYKASEGDVTKLTQADVIFYNGLHLEGKLEDVFEKMKHTNKKTIALAACLEKEKLIVSENFASNYDPHIWFQIDYWIQCVSYAAAELGKLDAKNKEVYLKNASAYIASLKSLKQENEKLVSTLPAAKRILITAHDAFNYFGKLYDFQVVGLQGLSTATEAGVQDVQNLANFIIKNNVKAIFVESSVPKRTIEALQASVQSKNHEVIIGGELFSDALGTANTPEATYVGMYAHNMSTIVNGLK